jgi:hypothetical protein
MSKHLVTECEQPFVRTHRSHVRLALELFQRSTQTLKTTHQEILLVVEVRIESRAADVGAINDVLHRERFKSILLDQGHHCRAEELLRPLHTAVIFSCSHHTFTF